MKAPSEYDWRCLMRVGRYIAGKRNMGNFLPKVDPARYPAGVVALDTHTDTDWAGDRATRKSIGC
eukprot:2397073-Lingulodinium_polyedra.AAC.1